MSSLRHSYAVVESLPDTRALSWWRALCALAGVNVCLWLVVWYAGPGSGLYAGWQLTLSGVYVLVCAYRSVVAQGLGQR